jgi:hypothetical protein
MGWRVGVAAKAETRHEIGKSWDCSSGKETIHIGEIIPAVPEKGFCGQFGRPS